MLEKKGVPYEKRTASLEEYKDELIKKLEEEVNEFAEAGAPEELADVLALRKLPGYEKVEELRLKKRNERGGFDNRIVLKGEK